MSKGDYKTRFNEHGEIFCTYGNHYLPPEQFSIYKNINNQEYYASWCRECRRKYNRERKQDDYPKMWWRIQETEENKLYSKVLLTLLGYDTESSIPVHKQFEKKFANKFGGSKNAL